MFESLVKAVCDKHFEHVKFTPDAISLLSDVVAKNSLSIFDLCARICAFRDASRIDVEDLRFAVRRDAKKTRLLEKFLERTGDGAETGPWETGEGVDYDPYLSTYVEILRETPVEIDWDADAQARECLVFLAYIDAVETVQSVRKARRGRGPSTMFSRENVVNFDDVSSII